MFKIDRLLAVHFISLCLTVSCGKKSSVLSEVKTSCRASQATPEISESAVQSSVPNGVQTQLTDTYAPNKYLKIDSLNIHIFGSPTSSNWMMVRVYEMAKNIVDSLNRDKWKANFSGHEIFVVTDSDPVIPGGLPGQRNTGNNKYTVVNEVLVCATAVDTIRPNLPAVYRAWDTPVHEFGHSVDQALGIRASTASWFRLFDPYFSEDTSDEHLAWTSESWFGAALTGTCGAERLSEFQEKYFSFFFTPDQIWVPSCAGRPAITVSQLR
jgi:hypothetical protein